MTQLTPIRGFVNTPVSRAICVLTTVFALLLSILSLKHYAKLSLDPLIIEYGQYWRLATYQLSVINESDYLLCIILWFHFKNLERFYGSQKYLSLITIFALYNSLISILFMSIGQLLVNFTTYTFKYVLGDHQASFMYNDTIFNQLIPGPLGIISSLYICYGTFIPVSYHFNIILSKPKSDEDSYKHNLTLTNHFQIQILYTLLLINNGFASLIPCCVGIFIGKLHTNDLLPGSKDWLIPSPIFQLFINPVKFWNRLNASLRSRFRNRYQPLRETTPNEHEEETEEALDENQDERNEIRAETPVRPLGSQFLDTFRT